MVVLWSGNPEAGLLAMTICGSATAAALHCYGGLLPLWLLSAQISVSCQSQRTAFQPSWAFCDQQASEVGSRHRQYAITVSTTPQRAVHPGAPSVAQCGLLPHIEEAGVICQ